MDRPPIEACLSPILRSYCWGTLRFVVLSLVVLFLAPGKLEAHPVAPALLRLSEAESGVVEVDWKGPPRRGIVDLVPRLDSRCAVLEEPQKRRLDGEVVESWSADCGERGLVGAQVVIEGLEANRGEVLVFANLASGRRARTILRPDAASWRVPGDESAGAIFGGYLRLGFEHILAGLDHLLFVLGLVLLVSGWTRLAWTITGFTAGHSVTLAFAALGWISVPQAPIELLIAASILLLAVELTRGRDSKRQDDFIQRQPWIVAGAFGLLHGLGFAGALAEIGLPQGEIPLALLAFNLGIEAGQLAFVVVILTLAALVSPLLPHLPRWTRLVPPYAIGSLATFWVFERLAALL